MSAPFPIAVGDIVQLTPDASNRAFAFCLMVVTEVKGFGAQGYVQVLGEAADAPGGQAYYRANWDEMTHTGGRVRWEAA